MRYLVALCFAAIPAAGVAGTPYVAIEAGALLGRDNDVDVIAGEPIGAEFDDSLSVGYRTGRDLGLIAGYDFGWFRLEAEASHKQARLKPLDADENFSNLVETLNGALGRDPAGPGLPPLVEGDFDLDGKIRADSLMINGLVDIALAKQLTAYTGAGYGRAHVRALGDSDSAWSWQYIVGLRYALSDRIELGIKHRYFNSGIVKLQAATRPLAGNGAEDVATTSEIEGELRTRSWLLGLHLNL